MLSELMAIHYGREHFKRVVIVRPHNVFGPDNICNIGTREELRITEVSHRIARCLGLTIKILRCRRRKAGRSGGVLTLPN